MCETNKWRLKLKLTLCMLNEKERRNIFDPSTEIKVMYVKTKVMRMLSKSKDCEAV